MPSRQTSAAVLLAFVVGAVPLPAQAATSPQRPSPAPHSATAAGFAESASVREIWARQGLAGASDETGREGDEEINERNSMFEPALDPDAPPQYDGALQRSVRFPNAMPAPSLTFEGNSAADNTANYGSTVAPPDTNGDVGLNDYIQTTNNLVRIWDKAGAPRGPAFKMSSLFAGVAGPCSTNDQGDPIVLFDRIANRWLLSQFAFASQTVQPWYECIAVSKTPDPTGPWYAYAFQTAATGFPDYPKLGAWSDAYYMTTREFNPSFVGHGAYAFDRAKMLVGDPTAGYVYFTTPASISNASSGMVPTNFQGFEPPPAGAANVFAIFNDDAAGDASDSLRLFNFHADFATPANSTFTARAESPLAVAAFNSISPSGRGDIEQPPPAVAGATDNLDSIGDRLMPYLQYIKRGSTESWIAVHTVNAGTPGAPPTFTQYQAAPRYYELRRTSPAGALSVNEQATFAPDATERWMPSATMDIQGDIAVGYSISSTSVFPGVAWAGRLAGDPANQLAQGEAVVFAGTGVQRGTSNRWGDYSSMALDPADGCTFWYTQEYYATSPTGGFAWQTRVGKFAFPTCTAATFGTLAGTVTALDTGLPLANSQVVVSGGPSDGFSTATLADGTYTLPLLPGTYTVTITNPDRNCSTVATFPGVVIAGSTVTTQNATLDGSAKYLVTATALGNNNGIITNSDCNTLNVTVRNVGCHAATGVTANLSTSTSNVVVRDPNTTYPSFNENATATNAVPFQLSTSAAFTCGTPVAVSLALSSANGSGTLPISLPSCNAPDQVFTGTIDGSEPTMTNRISRNGVASTCSTSKTCAQVTGVTPNFDQYTVTNSSPVTTCLTATLTNNCAVVTNQIFTTAYLGSFTPGAICTNYIGEAGLSPPATAGLSSRFSFNLASAQSAVFVVNNVPPSTTCTGGGYTLTVSGFLDVAPGPGECTTPVELQHLSIE